MAQPAALLSATASEPTTMGWMQGFPPPSGKTIRLTDPDNFWFPKPRWTVCNFREPMPTVGVNNGIDRARRLTTALDPPLDQVTFTPLGIDKPMTWSAAFDANDTDGIMVLHHGRVLYERYAACLTPDTLHGAMSVSKSLTGLLAEILGAEGKLDEAAPVGSLIGELKNSAFGDATVRQVMDMTTALDYFEDYADPKAQVGTCAEAGSAFPSPTATPARAAISSFCKRSRTKPLMARRSATRP